jgi:hypothetical protein
MHWRRQTENRAFAGTLCVGMHAGVRVFPTQGVKFTRQRALKTSHFLPFPRIVCRFSQGCLLMRSRCMPARGMAGRAL